MEMIIPGLSEPVGSGNGSISETENQILTETGFFWREADNVRVLVCRPLEEAGFANGFSTRGGGVSDFPEKSLNLAGFNEDSAENIYENRRRFLRAFEGGFRLAMVWQVHGDQIKTVNDPDEIGDSEEKADAVVSNLPNVLAGAKTADCVPVLIGDPVTHSFAAVHAGWRGTAASIVMKAVQKLGESYGANPANMIAAIGPAAGCSNYEVGQDVLDAFTTNFNGSEKYFKTTREGHALVDLHRANRDQLSESGIREANIYTAPFCTMARPDLFFSYRLEKRRFGKTGRLLSVIGLA